jgi:hypothetical protein
MTGFVVYATKGALRRAGELGFVGCLEVATEDAIRDGGFRRRIPPADHEYAIAGDLVVRTRYTGERTASGRRKFWIVGVAFDQRKPHRPRGLTNRRNGR